MGTLVSEIQPSIDLRPFVRTYWSGEFNTDGISDYAQMVVPNGCIEVIIHLSGDHCSLIRNDEEWSRSPEFTLIGMYPRAYEVRFNRKVEVFGISFYPDGIQQIFGVAPGEFIETYEAGEDVLGRQFNEFCQRIREADTVHRPGIVDTFLMRQLYLRDMNVDYADQAMRSIRMTSGLVPVSEITEQIHISTRQLQRAFKKRFGLSLRDYLRITRMNAVQKYMLSSSSAKLTDLSYDFDFSDQSHFIREFKYHIGSAPHNFIRNKSAYIVNPG